MAFSTTLTADLGAGDVLISVASNIGARTTYPWRLVIDDEVMYVFDGVAEGLDWGVHRGADDTDPAAHLAGALAVAGGVGGSVTSSDGTTTVDQTTSIQFPAGTLTDLGAGVAGVAVLVTILGPFSFAFDDVGEGATQVKDGGYLSLGADLPIGSCVLDSFIVPTSAWNPVGGVAYAEIGIAYANDISNSAQFLTSWWVMNLAGSPPTGWDLAGSINPGPALTRFYRPFIKAAGVRLYIDAWTDGDPITQGEADAYAIIATPVS